MRRLPPGHAMSNPIGVLFLPELSLLSFSSFSRHFSYDIGQPRCPSRYHLSRFIFGLPRPSSLTHFVSGDRVPTDRIHASASPSFISAQRLAVANLVAPFFPLLFPPLELPVYARGSGKFSPYRDEPLPKKIPLEWGPLPFELL